MTLTDFLLARIAEDEAARVIPDGDPGWPFTRSAEEIAESERWKAECEAKRRIVEREMADVDEPDWVLLRLLAIPYADHPDYREEWRI
jgi:hypothetical protein